MLYLVLDSLDLKEFRDIKGAATRSNHEALDITSSRITSAVRCYV